MWRSSKQGVWVAVLFRGVRESPRLGGHHRPSPGREREVEFSGGLTVCRAGRREKLSGDASPQLRSTTWGSPLIRETLTVVPWAVIREMFTGQGLRESFRLVRGST